MAEVQILGRSIQTQFYRWLASTSTSLAGAMLRADVPPGINSLHISAKHSKQNED